MEGRGGVETKANCCQKGEVLRFLTWIVQYSRSLTNLAEDGHTDVNIHIPLIDLYTFSAALFEII